MSEIHFKKPGLRYRNPSLSSAFRIPNELKHSSSIFIAGYITNRESRFSINLQNGESENDDIYFHLNLRFDDDLSKHAVVRNSRFSGTWGSEEREITIFPLLNCNTFIISIDVFNDIYVVELNGEFISFNHRSKLLSNITHIQIKGSVLITDLQLPLHYNYALRSEKWLSFPGLNKFGDSLILKATNPSDIDRYSVNFVTGLMSTDDIAFNFNPQIDKKQIIFNSRIKNIWGGEQKVSNFFIGSKLELIHSIDENNIRTFINDKYIDLFKHRINSTLIRYCTIENNLLIENAIFNSLPINKDKYKNVSIIQTGFKSMPFKSQISPSKLIIVSGIVKKSPERFNINLQLSSNDIAIHFNPRWNDQDHGGDTLLFNFKNGGKWGSEIREKMILMENIYYDFIFKLTLDKEIEFFVNGNGLERNKVLKIKHPFLNVDINQIEINGSIDVKQVAQIK